MAAAQPLYGVPIRNAIASKDLKKMKSLATQAQQQLDEQKDLAAALKELNAAIKKLDTK